MCILSYIPAGIKPDEGDLLNGGILNPHGHGWAIADMPNRQIVVGKGMDIVAVLDEFLAARERFDGPALFHSRWATHGVVDETNAHPFVVGGSDLTVVAHNGILPCEPHISDDRSDTRLFADEILSTRYRRLDKRRAFQAMTEYIGSYNKLVILTVDPKYRKNAYIVNEKAGHWDSATGIWHSNYDYLGDTWRYKSTTTTKGVVSTLTDHRSKAFPVDVDETCDLCGMGRVGKAGFCDECGSCADCYEYRKDCQCWTDYHAEPDDNDAAWLEELADDEPNAETVSKALQRYEASQSY